MTKTAQRRRGTAARVPTRSGSSWPRVLLRHTGVALLTLAVFALFWFTRMEWSPDMRLWRAVGDASLVLLLLTMGIGPLARLWRPLGRLVPWRRELGIWFALLALAHAVLVFEGWTSWSVLRLLGFEFIPQLGRNARLEPGFGLANLVGVVALVWGLVLAATSSDRALRALGAPAWKWLHGTANVILYTSLLHTAYFLFLHYAASYHRAAPPANWFRVPFLVVATAVVAMQMAAFATTVRRRRPQAT